MELVRLNEPKNMNVLGLLLHGFLQNVLQDPKLAKRAQRLTGNVSLRAGTMWATLCFDGQGIEVVRGRTAKRRASVEGDMHALVGMVTGRGVRGMVGMLPPLVRGRVRIAGDPLFLLRMLPILTAGGP
jgi:hypothetical protein